jgi:predicted dehydrogenase
VAAVTQDGHAIGPDDVVEGNEGYGPLAGDAVRAMYGLPDGVTAHFSSYRNAAGSPSRFGLEIYGTAGVIRMGTGYLPPTVWLPDSSWVNAANGTAWRKITSAGVDVSEPLEDGGAHAGNLLAVKDLLAAIEEDRQPLNSVYDGRANAEMIVACFESQRQGGRVELPLANRENPLTKLTG